MIELLKGLYSNIENEKIKDINNTIKEVRSELQEYKYKNIIDDNQEYEIYKLIKYIDKIDIYDLSYSEVKRHIQKLIIIIEYIEL